MTNFRKILQLAPYRAIASKLQVESRGQESYVTLALSDFKEILRHFLRMLPFDEVAYLACDPELTKTLRSGRQHLTAFTHFVEHGYFEGRRPLPEYAPEYYDFQEALRICPTAYYSAMFRAMRALASFDRTSAEQHLRNALDVIPNSFQANRLIGLLLARTGRPVQAHQNLTAAAERNDEDQEVRLQLAAICQTLYLPDERVEHLRRASGLATPSDDSLRTALADALIAIGHIAEANSVMITCSRRIRGGDEIAIKHTVERVYRDARQRLRELIKEARVRSLSVSEEVQLSYWLACMGFRRIAMHRVGKITDSLGDGVRRLGSQSFVWLVETVRIAQGLKEAEKLIDLANTTDAYTRRYSIDVLYRLGNFRQLSKLAVDRVVDESFDTQMRCQSLAAIRTGNYVEALNYCRTWMTAKPDSSGWAMLAVHALTEKGEISSIHVPLGHQEDTRIFDWESPIPKRIVQFWNDEVPPPDVSEAMDSWQHNNPEFEYQCFNDKTGRAFMEAHFDESSLAAYDYCQHPAMRGDFFRLAYLSIYGGVFVDADEFNRLPLSVGMFGCADRTLMLVRNDRMAFFCSPIAVVPNHSLVGSMFNAARNALVEDRRREAKLDIWAITGPGVITRVVARQLLISEQERIKTLSGIAIMNAIDSARISQEASFNYKGDPRRNWRLRA